MKVYDELERVKADNVRLRAEIKDLLPTSLVSCPVCGISGVRTEDKMCDKCRIEQLEAELAEVRKKSEPTEFTKELIKLGYYLSVEHNDNYGQGVCERACAEIDLLTTKREHLLEKVALQAKENKRLTAELKAKDKRIKELQEYIRA